MANSREHFALDWTKGELLETLSTARTGLESYAEALENGEAADSPAAGAGLHACVNGLHQVHGTLVMLELHGVTLLADHLERVADGLRLGKSIDVAVACQSLMQGILELPGYLEELQAGGPDSDAAFLPLVNELRQLLGEPGLEATSGAPRVFGTASDAALRRFDAINGMDKTRRIRGVYQQVLLSLLKGGELERSLDTLRKVAIGMTRVCDGTPFAAQWQAFGEFVESLEGGTGKPLDGDAVKLLRRVDSEIRELAQTGAATLRRPLPLNLLRQLVDAAESGGRRSEILTTLRTAIAQGEPSESLSLSGRQALISAATALREELSTLKDRLDLFVRGGHGDVATLGDLAAPLKQIGSTLSLLGFESSKSIVLDQVGVLTALVDSGSTDDVTILNVAGALVQVDENLASITQSGKGEVERITDEAHRAVAAQARDGLDQVKQAIVDYVSSQWDVRHLQNVPDQIDATAGAVGMIPLVRAASLLRRTQHYVKRELMGGHVPSWPELDCLADALSGIDYYLERLASENPAGADDVLDLVERSLDGLRVSDDAPAESAGPDAELEEALPAAAAPRQPPETVALAEAGPERFDDDPVSSEPAPASEAGAQESEAEDPLDQPLFGGASDVTLEDVADEEAEPELAMESDEDFDLASELFDELSDNPAGESGKASPVAADGPAEVPVEEPAELEAELESTGPAHLGVKGPAVAPAADTHPALAVRAGLADAYDSDDEIVEIFVEEVDEVLGTIDEHLEVWAGTMDDEAAQTEIRRSFHTLKGSGRMVGANVLGEMAWSVENMLNRALDGTVPVTAEFVQVVRNTRALVPGLRNTFEQKTAPDLMAVSVIMEQADVLASGGSLADAGYADGAGHAEGAEEMPAAAPDSERQLFIDEADGHVAALAAAVDQGRFVLSDRTMRALHTLSGSAAMAGLTAVGELAGPGYDLAQALRKPGTESVVSGAQGAFFAQLAEALAETLEEMRAGREPEAPVQLIADADDLIIAAGEPQTAAALLTLPAVETVLKAPQLLQAWQQGAVDMALAEDMRGALDEIARVANAEEQPEVATLAGALARTYERFELESLSAAAHDTLLRASDHLLAQFDALAADQAPTAAADDLAALEALAVEAPADTRAADEGVAGLADFDLTDLDITEDDLAEGKAPAALPAHGKRPGGEAPAAAEVEARSEPARGDDGPSPAAIAAAAAAAGISIDDVDTEIIEVFFEEAEELLEALDQGINDWADEPGNVLHLENLLRALHTLKGGARLSGLGQLGDQAHDFETVLVDFQESGKPAETELFDRLHGRYDEIAAIVAAIKAVLGGKAVEPQEVSGQPHGNEDQDVAAVVDSEADAETSEVADVPAETAAPPPDNVAVLRRPEPAADTEAGDAQAERVAVQARSAQEVVRVGAVLLESLVNLAGESSIIRARVEQGMSDFTGALDEMETTIERLREQLRRLEIETETQVLFRQERLEGPSHEDFDPLEMDRYSHLQQLSRALGESASDMLDLKETLLYKAREAETLLLQQARVNTELQEGLMRSRMVPFSRLLPRLRRTVRQVAKELDKDVQLNAFNIEGELDRSLLERMVPPLEHMLRNAVDHGIEKTEARRSAGKSNTGRIDLRLSREGGDVVIEISDDGAGINVARVREKAVERGLMASDAGLGDDEISQFVLAPGFSTAASVTQISGRGVGMDVVHSEVKQLGGSISIFSEQGRGTRFVVRVPFTVSVNRALMVSVSDDLYAIPLNTIEGIVLLSPEELEALYAPDGSTFEYAGVPYRIQYLGSFLGREYHPQPHRGAVPMVLVRSGEHAVAVHVDDVQGSREIVVKSLGPQFAGVGGISGATILGDGSVVVILDLVALIRTRNAAGAAAAKRVRPGAARTRRVMVVDDSVTVRKVTSRLLERQGMDVIVAKDGVEAVSLLQEQRPDVMLLDIEMPRMDGFEVLRQVRHDDRLHDLPIVMISSRTGTKHQDRAAQLGVNRFLGKPFQESELLATIDELVN